MLNNVSGLNNSSTLHRFSKCQNTKLTLAANIQTSILDANPKRMYAAFVNNSLNDVTLVFQDKSKAELGAGIIIKGNGGSYEITLLNLYSGKVSGISALDTQISVVEGFE